MPRNSIHSVRSCRLFVIIVLTVFGLANLAWLLVCTYNPGRCVFKTETGTRSMNRVYYHSEAVVSSPGLLPTVASTKQTPITVKSTKRTPITVKSTKRTPITVKSTKGTKTTVTITQEMKTSQSNSETSERPDTCKNCFQHNFKFIIQNRAVCNSFVKKSTIDLIVLVFTIHGHFKERAALRQTWLAVSRSNRATIRYVFLLGDTKDEDLSKKVEQENDVHHDIIKESFVDSYQNLTYKTVMGLKWVTYFCSKARFVMKTDDDMYVNLPAIVRVLIKEETALQSSVSGYCKVTAKPIREPRSKWYAPIRSYPQETYPGYCSGTGYVMSKFVAVQIYEISKMVPFFHLEDVYVSLCVKQLGFKLRQLPGFLSRRKLDPCLMKSNRILTSHKVPMDFLYKIMGAKCT
ncbi:beta-1,3-galactosyltransferase 1-like [Gigantopelta aegis]|uniref:beta-1,3-galactosyltransferase 1-like n=1 Tax=Gigantopelta aegis TaxID=1735272 RepID=UPI001B88BE96|nr:beta-1,3-galactosyltransferase 1-like [Gigantopelta aegis]